MDEAPEQARGVGDCFVGIRYKVRCTRWLVVGFGLSLIGWFGMSKVNMSGFYYAPGSGCARLAIKKADEFKIKVFNAALLYSDVDTGSDLY